MFLEDSACTVTASYTNTTTGAPVVPVSVQYRVDDVASGENIVPWTSITPASTNSVVITAAQNAMVSLSRSREDHQVLFQVTDSLGNLYNGRIIYTLVRVVGLG